MWIFSSSHMLKVRTFHQNIQPCVIQACSLFSRWLTNENAIMLISLTTYIYIYFISLLSSDDYSKMEKFFLEPNCLFFLKVRFMSLVRFLVTSLFCFCFLKTRASLAMDTF